MFVVLLPNAFHTNDMFALSEKSAEKKTKTGRLPIAHYKQKPAGSDLWPVNRCIPNLYAHILDVSVSAIILFYIRMGLIITFNWCRLMPSIIRYEYSQSWNELLQIVMNNSSLFGALGSLDQGTHFYENLKTVTKIDFACSSKLAHVHSDLSKSYCL